MALNGLVDSFFSQSESVGMKGLIGHFRDKSFQAIDCTGTDNQKQRNKVTHAPVMQRQQIQKLVLAKSNI